MTLALHITGASGSGTTTLGRALADALGLRAVDTDDHYWAPTEPPYQTARPVTERLERLERALAVGGGWVLSGSLGRWADPVADRFTGVIFLTVPTEVRLARLRTRERAAFGAEALAPGGVMHENHAAFLEWAARYDDGPATMRSRRFHEAWLAERTCPVLHLAGEPAAAESLACAVAWSDMLRR